MQRFRTLSVAALVGLGSLVGFTHHTHAAIVINEAYGGGGNSGSTYTHDFIELYNNGLTTVDVSGYQIAYASATGTFSPSTNGTDTTAFVTLLPTGTTIPAGGYLLVQEAQGTGGTTALPSPFITDATPIAMGGSAFKLQLLDGAAVGSAVLDLVGVGSNANSFEGLAPAPGIGNTTSASRILNGVDTNQNGVDFAVGIPTPAAANVVPEPASLALIGLGAVGLIARRRRA